MLNFFRTNQTLVNIFLILYIFIVRGALLKTEVLVLPNVQGIWSYEMNQIFSQAMWIMPYFAMGLVFFQAIALNFITTRFRFSEETTLFSGVFYILLTSSVLELSVPTPSLWVVSFLIIILYYLFDSYRKSASAATIFNMGLWIAIGSLFQFSFGIYLLLGTIGLGILRAYSFKEMLMMLTGGFTVYFLVGFCYFYFDTFDLFWQQQFGKNLKFLDFSFNDNWITYVERIFYLLLILVSIVSQGRFAFKRSIQIQKYQSILYWSLLLAAGSAIIQANVGLEQLVLLAPALAIFMMYTFVKMERSTAETFHIVWIALVFALQFHREFGF